MTQTNTFRAAGESQLTPYPATTTDNEQPVTPIAALLSSIFEQASHLQTHLPATDILTTSPKRYFSARYARHPRPVLNPEQSLPISPKSASDRYLPALPPISSPRRAELLESDEARQRRSAALWLACVQDALRFADGRRDDPAHAEWRDYYLAGLRTLQLAQLNNEWAGLTPADIFPEHFKDSRHNAGDRDRSTSGRGRAVSKKLPAVSSSPAGSRQASTSGEEPAA